MWDIVLKTQYYCHAFRKQICVWSLFLNSMYAVVENNNTLFVVLIIVTVVL